MKIRNAFIGSTAGVLVAFAATFLAAVPASATDQATANPFIVPTVTAGDWIASQN